VDVADVKMQPKKLLICDKISILGLQNRTELNPGNANKGRKHNIHCRDTGRNLGPEIINEPVIIGKNLEREQDFS
jgi:hypothetical protein